MLYSLPLFPPFFGWLVDRPDPVVVAVVELLVWCAPVAAAAVVAVFVVEVAVIVIVPAAVVDVGVDVE